MHEIEKILKVISVRSIRQSYSHPLISFFFAQHFYCFFSQKQTRKHSRARKSVSFKTQAHRTTDSKWGWGGEREMERHAWIKRQNESLVRCAEMCGHFSRSRYNLHALNVFMKRAKNHKWYFIFLFFFSFRFSFTVFFLSDVLVLQVYRFFRKFSGLTLAVWLKMKIVTMKRSMHRCMATLTWDCCCRDFVSFVDSMETRRFIIFITIICTNQNVTIANRT